MLDHIVIAKEEDIRKLYSCNEDPYRYYKALIDDCVLPLKGSTFITPRGTALLKFMTWVWLSGGIHIKKHTPYISGDEVLLKKLRANNFDALEKRMTCYNGTLTLAQQGGAYGRLIEAAGIIPGNGLPRFAKLISESEGSQKNFLMKTMAKILYKDRFKTDSGYRPNYLFLNRHPTKEGALEHGTQIMNFINSWQKRFSSDQVKAYKDGNKYKCLLILKK